MRIAVDAGHGSYTAGKRTPAMPKDISFRNNGVIDVKKGESIREHTGNVGVAYYLIEELKRCGFDTIKTGFNDDNPYNDEDTTISNRQKQIKKANCDYSVSIHFNAYGDGISFNSGEGVGIYIHSSYPKDSEKLGKAVLKYLVKGTKQKSRGINKKALAMCNCNSLNVKGALLVETAFMTNLREATELMGSAKFWKEAAQEICQGICEFTGVKYIKEISMPKKSVTKKSSKEDIRWLQSRLNQILKGESYNPLEVDGVYGNKTRISLLIYWEKLSWNKDGKSTGWKAGKATRKALAAGRTK